MSAFFSALRIRKHIALGALLLGLGAAFLPGNLAAAMPANHEALLKNPTYKEAFSRYEASMNEAKERLTAKEFAALQRTVDESMNASVKEDMATGSSESEAWETACIVAVGTVNKELEHDWLRRNAKGVQGFYRLQGGGLEGFLCVFAGDEPNLYALKMEVARTSAPYAAAELDGFGRLDGKSMQAVDKSDTKSPLLITFDGEKAVVAESESFKKSGAAGNGVTFDGAYQRERK